jgi:hypothetical protein
MSAPKRPAKQTLQVLTLRINPTVLARVDALLEPLQADRNYQLLGMEDRSEVLRLVIAKGIAALEKELGK